MFVYCCVVMPLQCLCIQCCVFVLQRRDTWRVVMVCVHMSHVQVCVGGVGTLPVIFKVLLATIFSN